MLVAPEIMLVGLPNIRLNLTFVASLLKQVNQCVIGSNDRDCKTVSGLITGMDKWTPRKLRYRSKQKDKQMIEYVPERVHSAFLYLHSAGVDSKELAPFLPKLIDDLPNTYICAGDGVISSSPLMNSGTYYGDSDKRYWFMFPMQDATTQKSFQQHSEAMGASLLSSGAFLNRFVDQIKERFGLPTNKIVLSGFQHGSCLALTASMMRKTDPFITTILFEPYILEGYYLEKDPVQAETNVVCIENQCMRKQVQNWINVETDREFKKFGMNVTSIILDEGEEKLDIMMIKKAVKVLQEL